MKTSFDKFKEIKIKKDEESKLEQERFSRKWKIINDKCDNLFGLLKDNLKSFDGKSIKRKKIKLQIDNKKQKIDLFLNDNLSFIFTIERHSSHCSCENVCDHEPSYWHTVSVTELRENKEPWGIYFPCTSERDFQEDRFADAMLELTTSSNFW